MDNLTKEEEDGSGLSFRIVAHDERACEVWCFAKSNRKKQIIPVIGKGYKFIDKFKIDIH